MAIELDIKVGDVVLGGKFKNKRIVVKTIGKDDLGQPTINGMSLLKMRIEKLLPPEKQSKETREESEDMKKENVVITKNQLREMIREAIVTEQSGSMPGEGMNQVSPMQAQVQSFTDVIYDDWHTFIMTVESKARKNNVSYQVLAATVEKLFNDEISDY
jgi:hypothetical protein